jgi:hypothetical protein
MSWLSTFRPASASSEAAKSPATAADRPDRPPLDLAAPSAIETATFAFG